MYKIILEKGTAISEKLRNTVLDVERNGLPATQLHRAMKACRRH